LKSLSLLGNAIPLLYKRPDLGNSAGLGAYVKKVLPKGEQSELILSEAKKLWLLGLSLHWLRPGSKAPIKKGWTTNERDSWETLRSDYRNGYGLGVRLGDATTIEGKHLYAIDLDLKSSNPKHVQEAYQAMDSHFPKIRNIAPRVKTGNGFHFYLLSEIPLQSRKVAWSKDYIKGYFPSTEINARQRSELTEEELAGGIRLKRAWEIELMSTGKQVVLPPTRHPDTKKMYMWERGLQG
jgi:hypothetical protein